MIIVTLTKLFDINIVARSLSELSKRYFIFLSAALLSSSILLRSLGEREKNAISDAEMKPETYNKAPAKIIDTKAPVDGAVNVILENKSAKRHKYESGSKD